MILWQIVQSHFSYYICRFSVQVLLTEILQQDLYLYRFTSTHVLSFCSLSCHSLSGAPICIFHPKNQRKHGINRLVSKCSHQIYSNHTAVQPFWTGRTSPGGTWWIHGESGRLSACCCFSWKISKIFTSEIMSTGFLLVRMGGFLVYRNWDAPCPTRRDVSGCNLLDLYGERAKPQVGYKLSANLWNGNQHAETLSPAWWKLTLKSAVWKNGDAERDSRQRKEIAEYRNCWLFACFQNNLLSWICLPVIAMRAGKQVTPLEGECWQKPPLMVISPDGADGGPSLSCLPLGFKPWV